MGLRLSATGMIAAACIAHSLSMICFAAYPALLPEFTEIWSMNSTEGGSVSAAFFIGYTLSVPVLTILSDRIDPRRIYLFSSFLSAAGALGFAFLADGPASASLYNGLIGAGVGGTYMPGLKALGDHIDGRLFVRATGFYTGMFGFGAAMSYLVADGIFMVSGWPAVFMFGAACAVASGFIIFFSIPPSNPGATSVPLSSISQVFSNRTAVTWSVCYALHSGELFAIRSWIVAFLVFATHQSGSAETGLAAWLTPVTVAAIATILGLPMTIFGNELCIRFGRRLIVILVMIVTALLALATGASSQMTYGAAAICIVLYNAAIMADSSSITAGALSNSAPGLRGATMALHSTLGFAGGAVGPFIVGVMLDQFGGAMSAMAWTIALGQMALIGIICPILIKVMRPKGAVGDRGEAT
ncbi:MAG: MFS transporter [Alphaproteobacteria bacterium]|nr:MFS transporter [Alphaproteobacteria bacterium]